ncbi:hypothetical protein [Diaminobutyricimonas sp. TR449]|uniref:hypothetical protein n=1 Tax=Diaminobutyricimonas sp. TR449 TaxID=2708076 RepID=UPI001422E1DF|nr:hypothetical protein [Diaminobutyricimonas sp. TR449]
MDWWVVPSIVVAIIAIGVIAHHFGWIDLTGKHRTGGVGSAAFGGVDEVFFPTRHEAQVEKDRQSSLPAPAPVAGDGDKGIYDGRVKIDLPADDPSPER